MTKENRLIIHFKNKPFTAVIGGSVGKTIELTPVICDDQPYGNCGIGLMYYDVILQMWGLGGPRDLIASWRATEIVRHFATIDRYDLSKTFYAGRRGTVWNADDKRDYLDPVIALIGQELHDEIMSMPIPEEIIRAILDNQNLESPPDLFPIREEVEAGTIKWRQEFSDAGIKHPEEK